MFRQLLVRGLLAVDWEAHGALRLTEAARPVLRGEQPVLLRRDEAGGEKAGKARRSAPAIMDSEETRVFEALRALRRRLAEEQGVPPYVIFHDGVLTQMAQQRPQTEQELAAISGVGERKLARYGEAFLEVLREFAPPPAVQPAAASTYRQSLQLLLQGLRVEQIAQRRGLAASTVWGHIVQAVEEALLDYREIQEISVEAVDAITDAWLSQPEAEQGRLKPIHEALQGRYDYPILRCVITGLKREAEEGEQ